MYVNTHVYFAKQVHKGSPSGLAIVGSFLPDLAYMKVIGWNDLHNQNTIDQFCDFIDKTNPEYDDLGVGVNYHFLLDEITHHHYKEGTGYAYQLITPELINLVSKGFLIKDKETAKTISHNIIEIAVDNFVLEKQPELLQEVKNATKKVDPAEISRLVSSFFKSDSAKMEPAVEKFLLMVNRYDTRNIEECIKLCDELSQLLFGNHIKEMQVKQAILLARELVKDTYQEFLESSISAN